MPDSPSTRIAASSRWSRRLAMPSNYYGSVLHSNSSLIHYGRSADAELAVTRLVAEGLSNRDVAARLFISHHTVSGHLKNVFTKLAINSRVELVRIVDLNG